MVIDTGQILFGKSIEGPMWNWIKKHFKDRAIVAEIAFVFVGVTVANTLQFFIRRYYDQLLIAMQFARDHSTDALFQFAFAALVFVFAMALYAIRSRYRGFYASLESMFGVIAGVYVANQLHGA